MLIQQESSVPLYVQIIEYLRQQITDGVYPIGSRLPSERELAQTFNVSRMTARQALQSLRRDNFAYSRSGKGTYVQKPKIYRQLPHLTSFSQEMQRRGLVPSSRVLEARIEKANEEVSKQLQIPANTDIFVLKRVRLANGSPLGLETAHLVHDLCFGIMQKHDFNNESLYKVLRDEYGCNLEWANQSIEARLPISDESEILGIEPWLPLLGMNRTTFTQQEKAIEFTRAVFRADQWQLHIVLRLID